MKLKCDLCGGALQEKPDGAVCSSCGLEYGPDRLQEKKLQQKELMNTQLEKNKELVDAQLEKNREPLLRKEHGAADDGRMKIMWIILAVIAVITFIAGLMESGIIFLVCLVAALITLFVFKPWNVYGGKII